MRGCEEEIMRWKNGHCLKIETASTLLKLEFIPARKLGITRKMVRCVELTAKDTICLKEGIGDLCARDDVGRNGIGSNLHTTTNM